MIDRASILTAAILHVVRTRGSAEARAEITEILRDEISDIKRQTISEIRPQDE